MSEEFYTVAIIVLALVAIVAISGPTVNSNDKGNIAIRVISALARILGK
jgi:hypothetical protein